jgi:hypothetical protein
MPLWDEQENRQIVTETRSLPGSLARYSLIGGGLINVMGAPKVADVLEFAEVTRPGLIAAGVALVGLTSIITGVTEAKKTHDLR